MSLEHVIFITVMMVLLVSTRILFRVVVGEAWVNAESVEQ